MTTPNNQTKTDYLSLTRRLLREDRWAAGYRAGRRPDAVQSHVDERRSAGQCAVLPLRPR